MGNQQAKPRKHHGRKIDWETAERPSPPGKPYLVVDSADQPLDVITIRWDSPDYDGGAPIIGYLVEHRRTGSPHWLRATPYLTIETELTLTGLEPGWRYQFRVSAENDIGRSDPGDLSEPLTVTVQRSAATAPHFNQELQDTIALENEKVEFTVHVLGTPTPKVSWYKDGFEIFSSRRTKIVSENEKSTLIIHQAALEDEGELKCTATNRAGHVVTKCIVRVEAPPRVRLPRQYEDGLLFELGELIRLKVSVAGRPTPEVIWYHNGEAIETGGRYEITISERSSSLKVVDATRTDRGEYQIIAYNKIGEDVASCLVTITDRPLAPGKAQVVMTLGKSVTLSWTAPDDDGGCKIGNYIVEYFRIGWNMWLKAATCRQLTTVLGDLIEGSEYKFRVKAENPYGVSDPSEESDIIFIPDPKRGILEAPSRINTNLADPWLEEIKKRQLDEENNEQELKKRKGEEEEDKDEIARRKGLDQRIERLLGSHIPDIQQKTPVVNLENKRVRDKSEEMSFEESENVPPVPRRRKTKKSQEDNSIKDIESLDLKQDVEVIPKDDRKRWGWTPTEDENMVHGSSELMLVLLPQAGQMKKSVELTAQQKSEIEATLRSPDGGIAPPMSLSAPELGTTEILEIPPMRDAVSSTELLHERMMTRFYQDASEDDNQCLLQRKPSFERRSQIDRRHSTKEGDLLTVPKHLILEDRASEPRSTVIKFNEEVSEPSPSRTQVKLIPSTEEMKKEPSPNRSQLSKLIVSPEESKKDILKESSPSRSTIPKLISTEKSRKTLPLIESVARKPPKPKSILRKEERLNSIEREQLEFAKIRDRLKEKNEIDLKPIELPPRPEVLQQTSMSSQVSSYDGGEEQSREEEFEGEGEDEELEDEEEEDGYLELEDVIDEEVEDEIDEEEIELLNDTKFRPKTIVSREPPPPVPRHGLPPKVPSPPIPKKPAPFAEEEETYHPRSMVPTRSFIQKLEASLPTTEEIPDETEIEIKPEIGKQKELEVAEVIEKKSEEEQKIQDKKLPTVVLQEPMLEVEESKTNKEIVETDTKTLEPPKKPKKESRILKKIEKALKKKEKPSALQSLIADSAAVTSLTTVVLPKPILKKKQKEKGKVKVHMKDDGQDDEEDEDDSWFWRKKKVRITEPGSEPPEPEPEDPLTRRERRRKQRLEEEERVNKVLIYHYNDILKEYGSPKKQAPKIYLEYEDLKAHAKEENDVEIPSPNKEESEGIANIEEEITSEGSLVEEPEDEVEGIEPTESESHLTIANLSPQPPSPRLTPDRRTSKSPAPDRSVSKSPVPDRSGSKSPAGSERSGSKSPSVSKNDPVSFFVDYMTDFALFLVACWLYLFKDERYAIPVLCLMVYRQVQETTARKYRAVKNTIISKLPARFQPKTDEQENLEED